MVNKASCEKKSGRHCKRGLTRLLSQMNRLNTTRLWRSLNALPIIMPLPLDGLLLLVI